MESSEGPTITSDATRSALEAAVHDIRSSLPVVVPTETVYGLAASALDEQGVLQIFSTKGRPADNPLIVHVSSLPMLGSLLPSGYQFPRSYDILIRAFWPGPLTIIFPKNVAIPSVVTAGHATVAIRFPSHPVARALIALADAPLAAPSANSSGKPSPTKASHALNDLSGKVGIILDGGPCDVGVESTVIDGLGADGAVRVLRPGGVTVEDLEKALDDGVNPVKVLVHKRDYVDEEMEDAPTTPGMKYRHYSPAVPVILLCASSPPSSVTPRPLQSIMSDLISRTPVMDRGHKFGLLSPSDSPLTYTLSPPASSSPHPYNVPDCAAVEIYPFHLGALTSPASSAQKLFDGLLTLEREGVDLILVEAVNEEREGLAIMNRVRKAAGEVHWVTT